MGINFINIQAYEIKLTRKFKYTENLAGTYVTQVDVDVCYEWRPLKSTSCIRGYHHYQSIWMPGLVCL